MNIWQAAFEKWWNDVYLKNESRKLEPDMHVSHGMTRKCETQLLGMVAVGCSQYIELGCGDGYSLLLMKRLGLMCFGFDRVEPLEGVGTSYIKCDILKAADGDMTEEFKEKFNKLVDSALEGLPIFVYCDNGNKVKELQYVAPLLKSGDIIGTHDYPTEVPMGFVPGNDYELITEHDAYIEKYACLQRFWRKL